MKVFRIGVVLLVVISGATLTFGQYGLYGSPDTINVPQQTPTMVPSNGYVAPAGGYAYPGQTAYVAQQPVQTYTPQQVYAPQQTQPYPTQAVPAYPTQAMQAYPTQPVQQYPVQQMQAAPARPAATYGQASPQYRMPTNVRPAYNTGAAVNQHIARQQSVVPGPQMATIGQNQIISEPAIAPGIQQESGMMNEMLAEQGQVNGAVPANSSDGYTSAVDQCGVYRKDANRFEQAACGTCAEACEAPCLWYGSVSALVMTRDRPNKVYLTYETGNLPHNDFPVDEFSWNWGGEVTFGRRFCGGCNTGCNSSCGYNPGYWALEASYWTLDPMDSYVSHTSPVSATNPNGTVGTPLRVSDIQFGGSPGTTWFDNAAEHRLWRTDEIHNVEVNFVRGQWSYGNDSPWDLGWGLGVRYFRFQESWRFGSLMDGYSWGEGGGLYEAYLSNQITNDLIGPQIGFELGYSMCSGLRFYMEPKFGIYNNNIKNYFQAYLGDGTIATTGSSGVPGTYPVDSSLNTLAFLTQFDVGLDWQFARRWNAQVGYRVVAISGLGLADAQIPFYIVDIPEIAEIDRNGDMILHGAYATIGFNF